MADVYKGLTIQFGADTVALSAALKKINSEARTIGAELKKVDNALKFNPGNTDLLRQRQVLLAKQVETTKKRLDALKQAQAKLGENDVNSDQYRNLQREIIETGSKLENLEQKAKDTDKALAGGSDPTRRTAGLKQVGKVAATAATSVAAAGAAAAVALGAVAVKAMQSADELQKQADVTGLSAERLQELQYIGVNLGVELDTIVGANAKLTKSMDAARDGSKKQAGAFKTLGIQVTDHKGKLRDSNVVMQEAFQALGKVKNETERNALAQKLFGKSAKDLNPLIRAGGDEMKRLADQARSSGAVMSNEAVGGLDSLGDSVSSLKQSAIGIVGQALSPLFASLSSIGKNKDFVAAFNEIKAALQQVWNEIVTQAGPEFRALAKDALPVLILNIRNFAEGLRQAAPFIGMVARLIVVVIRNAVALSGAMARTWAAILGATRGIAGAFGTLSRLVGVQISVMGSKWRGMVGVVSSAFGSVFGSARSIFGKVVSFIGTQVQKIRGFFSGLVLRLPHIKLPHFHLNGSFSINPPRVPTIGIDWYARGGSFAPNTPQLIGVGDQGRGFEHVLRDDQIVSLMNRALDNSGGRKVVQNITIEQPVQSYAETRRAMRHAAEEIAW